MYKYAGGVCAAILIPGLMLRKKLGRVTNDVRRHGGGESVLPRQSGQLVGNMTKDNDEAYRF